MLSEPVGIWRAAGGNAEKNIPDCESEGLTGAEWRRIERTEVLLGLMNFSSSQ